MAVNIGPKIGIEGEAQYRKELNNIIQQSKTLASEMKTVTAAFGTNDKSQEALTAQTKVLTKQIETQQQRVDKLSKGLADATQKFGQADTKTLKWQQAVNDATAELNRMKNQLSTLENGVEDTGDALEQAGDQAAGFGDVLKANVVGQFIVDGVKQLASAAKDMAGDFLEAAASVKAQTSQFSQTFKEFSGEASQAISRVADESGILDTRLNALGTQIFAFAKSSGGSTEESMQLMETALRAAADSAAYYDKSLEETTDTLQSFLKGNYENDAALGLSATETTRNAAAMEQFGKKFNDLTEIQKQQTLLQMVLDAQELSGAMGQASREADGWENVQGNLNEAWRQFSAAAGKPFLENLVPVIQEVTQSIMDMTNSVDWDAFGDAVSDAFQTAIKTGKELKPVLVGIGTAAASMGLASAAAGAKTALVSLLTSINPVVLGVTGLVAVMAAATAANIDYAKSAATIVETDAERNNRMKELRDSYESVREAASQQASADMAEIANAQRLYDELKDLATVNGEVSQANRSRAEFILSQLNSALGTEYQMTGNIIGNYREMDTAIKNLIETKQAEILLTAAEDAYAQAVQNKAEVEKNTAIAHMELVAQQNAADETRRELTKTIEEEQKSASYAMDEAYRNYVQNKINNLYIELEEEEKALAERQEAYDENQQLLNRYYADIEAYESAAAAAQQGNTDKVIWELDRQNAGFMTAKDVAAQSAQEQTRILSQQYATALTELYLYAKNFEQGTKGYTAQGLSTLAQFAIDAGEEAKQAGVNIDENLSQQLSAVVAQSATWGADMISGLSAGIRSKIGVLAESVKTAANTIYSRMHFSRPDVGPLRDYETWMPDMMAGMAKGITQNAWRLEEALNAATGNLQANVNVASLPQTRSAPAAAPSISIVVNAAPGMDENALAQAVARRIQSMTMRKEAVW